MTHGYSDLHSTQGFTNPVKDAFHRESPRVPGPFDGRWCGALSVPLRICDLSIGGCLVESHYQVTVGGRIELEINLLDEGWVTVLGEILYLRQDYGFAVKFVAIDEEARTRLERLIDRLT